MNYNLALHSDQVSPESKVMDLRVLELIRTEKPKIGYISSTPDRDMIYFNSRKAYYGELGAELTAYTDEENANNSDDLKMLLDCDAIHLSGGNTFYFLNWLRSSRLENLLKEYASQGKFLIGVSAGAILMTPSIETSLICGDDDSLFDGNTSGLSLVDFQFLPHYTKGQIFSKQARRILSAYKPSYLCSDGAGLIVNNGDIEFFGEASFFS